jgi:hypothetical protein
MKIVSLHIYPIKALGGISLTSSKLLGRGLEFDRRWMLVDAKGTFVSQRKYAILSLFSVRISNAGLSVKSGVTGRAMDIPFVPEGGEIKTKVWDDTVQAVEVSAKVSDWFSTELKADIRLVYMPDNSKRQVDQDYALHNEIVSFADAYPILIANRASLNDLNTKLHQRISMERFRANIIVDGTTAFEEDNWHHIELGTAKVEVVKKCSRCGVVNIDPEVASSEPSVLKTLASYRKFGTKICFGASALIHKDGVVVVGDELNFIN